MSNNSFLTPKPLPDVWADLGGSFKRPDYSWLEPHKHSYQPITTLSDPIKHEPIQFSTTTRDFSSPISTNNVPVYQPPQVDNSIYSLPNGEHGAPRTGLCDSIFGSTNSTYQPSGNHYTVTDKYIQLRRPNGNNATYDKSTGKWHSWTGL
tara:strand:+ start:18576 stop:19025 length:450 start_codon:yes stop_codon:yes gene_type:complete